MFDEKKLEAFLASLEVDTHLPKIEKPRHSVYALVKNPALEAKMDKYDIFSGKDYENVGTPEFPIWARQTFYFGFIGRITMQPLAPSIWQTYGGIQRSAPNSAASVQGYYNAPTLPLSETPYGKLCTKLKHLKQANAQKLSDPNPRPTSSKSPDYVHTLTAWRGWTVENGRLAAIGTEFEWEPKRAARAICKNEHHPAPQSNCSCGFWSFKTLDLITEAMSGYANTVQVLGTVEIWGRVIECENGFRSEYAYPKELWLLEEGHDALSWEYGVPVRKL